MSFYEKSVEILQNWDKEAFRDLHHVDFLFIRETELVTLDDYIELMDKFMIEEDGARVTAVRMAQGLIHENEYVSEIRWEDGGEIVTNVFMKKDGLGWRSIVNRVPKLGAS